MSKLKFVWRIILRSFLSNQDDFSNHVFMTVIRAHIKLRLELRQGVEGGGPDPAFPLLYSPLFFFFFHCFREFFFRFQKQKDTIGAYTYVSWYHTWGIFFFFLRSVTAAMLLIVTGWLKRVKKETWSHSGRCLVCK